jgi:hypothetical protein
LISQIRKNFSFGVAKIVKFLKKNSKKFANEAVCPLLVQALKPTVKSVCRWDTLFTEYGWVSLRDANYLRSDGFNLYFASGVTVINQGVVIL